MQCNRLCLFAGYFLVPGLRLVVRPVGMAVLLVEDRVVERDGLQGGEAALLQKPGPIVELAMEWPVVSAGDAFVAEAGVAAAQHQQLAVLRIESRFVGEIRAEALEAPGEREWAAE